MKIKIKALDTLFFRDGKPFAMGDETWADGVFPPSPSVFYGALRTLYFSENPNLIEKANTVNDPTAKLEITGIYFCTDTELHFINPKDSVVNNENRDEFHLLSLEKNTSISTSVQGYHLTIKEQDLVVKESDGFISFDNFKRYVTKNRNVSSVYPFSDFINNEPKVGIGRNNDSNSTEEGLLYRVGMSRLSTRRLADDIFETDETSKDLYFIVEFEGLNLIQTEGFIKLGGENKVAVYSILNEDLHIPTAVIDKTIFKLYLLTPALFEKGWYPKWLRLDNETGLYSGAITYQGTKIGLRLITASIGKPIHIGGYDMKKREPKPMLKAVPTGSIYYFELEDGSHISLLNSIFHLKSISDFKSNEGFGITILANPTTK